MLFNAKFGMSYDVSMVDTLNWLAQADKKRLECSSMHYWLLDGNPDVNWNRAHFTAFISGA